MGEANPAPEPQKWQRFPLFWSRHGEYPGPYFVGARHLSDHFIGDAFRPNGFFTQSSLGGVIELLHHSLYFKEAKGQNG